MQRELRAAVSGAVTGPVRMADWFGRSGDADALVRATDVDDVVATLAVARRVGAAVVPIGGNTGLVGGTVRAEPGPTIALSLVGLTGCEVDPVASAATVGAGVTVADLHTAARAHGLTYGVDLASRDSATIGGTIATNAGGIHVCAYGSTRRQVLGLQVVLADGSVLTDLRGLPKDNTGYSLLDLMVGSEGTLGIVTAARVALHPQPGRRLVMVFRAPSLSQCVAAGRRAGALFGLLACEVVDDGSWREASADLSLRDPLPAGHDGYVCLLELDLGSSAFDEAVLRLGAALDLSDDVAVGSDEPDRAALWQVREAQAEWWSVVAGRHHDALLHKFDVTLPLATLDDSTAAITDLLAGDGRVLAWGVFGHVFEGSLHIQLVARDAIGLDRQILTLVSQCGGSLSAEHGVGRDKAAWLGLRRSAAEVRAMTAIKRALDPAGILNPGVLFDV